jgi:hypothetical protein
MMHCIPRATLLLVLASAACGGKGANPACGITALAGATMLLDQFSVPEQTLTTPPRTVPPVLPVRLAAGPAWRGLVTTAADSTWIVRVEGTATGANQAGFRSPGGDHQRDGLRGHALHWTSRRARPRGRFRHGRHPHVSTSRASDQRLGAGRSRLPFLPRLTRPPLSGPQCGSSNSRQAANGVAANARRGFSPGASPSAESISG